MAMYLLIEFDDDAQAEALLEKVRGRRSFRPVGLFKKPTLFCECGPIPDSQAGHQITRGERWGIYVHRACRRARKAPQAPRNLLESDARASDRNFFIHLTPNYPLTVHNVSRSE